MSRSFMAEVEMHERAWGTQSYSGRPSLAKIMEARIVVFWRENRRDPGYHITLHENTKEIQKYVNESVLDIGLKPPARRLARLYVNQKRIRIKGVKIIFEMDELEQS
ncbi:MAG: hypothetical protein H6672_17905 [Anaerolineaceae bacterium]|nr:hypothetical protein [Anaerolineaceae bacterium]